MASGLQLLVVLSLQASESAARDPSGTKLGVTPATAAGRAWHRDVGAGCCTGSVGSGEAEPAHPGDPAAGGRAEAAAPHNCSSQPCLISGEISGVPAQRDAEPPPQHGIKGCGSSAQCRGTATAIPAREVGRGAAGVPLALSLSPLSLALCCIFPALLLPSSLPLKLSFPCSPSHGQQWAAWWGPGGRGVGAAPCVGLAARLAAARSPSRPGTEGSPVRTSSSVVAAWGSTQPAAQPKVRWVL